MIPVAYTYYLGPLLTLSAAMFALTMLNKNNEIMPLKAAGVSLYRIATPIFCLAAFFSVLTFMSQELLIPGMRDWLREVYTYSHSSRSIREQNIPDGKGNSIQFGLYWPAQKRAEHVNITYSEYSPKLGRVVERRSWAGPSMYWEPARDGDGEDRGYWVLRSEGDVYVEECFFDEKGNQVKPEGQEAAYVKHLRWVVDTDLTPEDFESAGENIQYLSLADLNRRLSRRQASANQLLVKIHQHWAFPLTHIVLLLLGLPFVLNQNNRSVFLGVLVAVAICLAFFVVNAMCMELGTKGVVQPVVAAWLPVLFFSGLGVVLFDNLRT
jgi:lipopolysaccharide export LptBFGC system permease protein LptF